MWLSGSLASPKLQMPRFHRHSPVAVVVGLVGAINGKAEVVRLLCGEGGQLDGQGVEVGSGDLLVKLLGEHVHIHSVLSRVAPQLNLGQHLVGEGGGHDKAGVAHGTAQVDQTALSQQDQVLAILECEPVHLGLDVGLLLAVLLQPLDLDLAVKVADVANNGVVLHHHEMLAGQDVFASSGGDKDVTPLYAILHSGDLIALHGCLQSIDGVDLSDDHPATETPQGLGAALANVSVAGDHCNLACQHNVCGTLDPINQRLPAAVQVVKLGLGDRVVDVDGRNLESATLGHLVEVVHTSGSLLGDTLDALKVLGILLVDEIGQVATIVEDHV